MIGLFRSVQKTANNRFFGGALRDIPKKRQRRRLVGIWLNLVRKRILEARNPGTMKGSMELFEGNDLEMTSVRMERSGARGMLSRWRIYLCVFVTLLLIAVMGLLIAMFGPGSKDLRYPDPEDCEVKKDREKQTTGFSKIQCDVAVIGGGLSGLYMAETLLRKKKETSVCVFEKESRFGGRILDHMFAQAPDVSVGLGALRVDNSATNMIDLIRRLNISTVNWDFHSPSLIESRGVFANNSKKIKQQAFPTLDEGKFKNMTSNEMLSYAFSEDRVLTASSFASVDSYMSHYLSPEASEFLSELYGYKGEYTEPINPASYIEYIKMLLAELADSSQRPLKGVSAVIDALVFSAKSYGVKLFAESEVLSIEKIETMFTLRTATSAIYAPKLVIAAHPVAFMKVKGKVSEEIHREPVFQSIQIQTAFKGAAVYSEAWWEKIGNDTGNLSLEPRQKFISNSNCLGATLPYGGRGPNGEAVLHTMYMDGVCSRKWGDVLKISKSSVDRELKRALEYKFRRPVPDPLDTVYQYWGEGAWHFQKPGFNYTLADVSNWAKRPFPDQDIFIIGDAYNRLRGWTEGAILSANNALLEGWKIQE